MQVWQTKLHAITVHDLVPAECIYKVISQNGDRILFERLSIPRPAPKVTLRSNWPSQQQWQRQQQSICDDVSISTRKLVTDQTGIRVSEATQRMIRLAQRKLVRNPEPPVDKKPQFEFVLRTEGVSQDAILQDEAKMNEINEKLESKTWDHEIILNMDRKPNLVELFILGHQRQEWPSQGWQDLEWRDQR